MAGYLTRLNSVFIEESKIAPKIFVPEIGPPYTHGIFKPGTWNPPGPFYLVPPNKIAKAFLVVPGLIIHDLYSLRSLEQAPSQLSLSVEDIALALLVALSPAIITLFSLLFPALAIPAAL